MARISFSTGSTILMPPSWFHHPNDATTLVPPHCFHPNAINATATVPLQHHRPHHHDHHAGATPLSPLSPQAVAGCRLAQALTQYCVGANYGWLLAEGLFLHKLLVLATFSGDRCLPAFLLLGWGEVAPWPHIPMSPCPQSHI